MKDSLAIYWIEREQFDRMKGMDFIEGGETAMFLERRAHHIAEFITEGDGPVGEVLSGLQPILGAPFGDMLGRNDAGVGPGGPHTFCGHLGSDSLEAMLGALVRGQSLLGKEEGAPLLALESRLGPPGWFARLLPALARFLRAARGANGPVVCVYTRW